MDIYDEQPDQELKNEILDNKELRDQELENYKRDKDQQPQTEEGSPVETETELREVENLPIDDGEFTGTLDKNGEPVQGKFTFSDGSTYEGTFTKDGNFKEGKLVDKDNIQEGTWNDDESFTGTFTDVNTL